MKHKQSLVWLRRDLRLLDNTALSEATLNSESVALVFVFDTQILNKLKKTDKRISFIYDTLIELDAELNKYGSKLIIKYGDPIELIPKLVKKLKVDALFYNEDYESYSIKRDSKVSSLVKKDNVEINSFKDHVIFSGNEVLKGDGSPYQVFTPYKKQWLKKLSKRYVEIKKVNKNFISGKITEKYSDNPSISDLGFERAEYYYRFQHPGRKNAVKQLKSFSEQVNSYNKDRDFPALDGTSGLSVHLRFGTISVRECVRMAIKSRSKGNEIWLSEIVWRDFYHMILVKFPHVRDKCFKPKCDKLIWKTSSTHFKKWCKGETGFPIVDAAMRQLNHTGWMHNRLRMIVASFLTKDLLVDWKKGEAYFAEKLQDFDFAANNGGWQWSASTGCDAQPYFRVFNPELQSRRFDPEGEFIKKWVPELMNCSKKEIHAPTEVKGYPRQVVDHQEQKAKAIAMFKEL